MRAGWRWKLLGVAVCVIVAYAVSVLLRHAGASETMRTIAVIAVVLALSWRMDLTRTA